jgi:putative nucleotidyltransferase with HDIG domain
MSFLDRRPLITNLLIIAITVVFVGVTLVIGRPAAAPATVLAPGDPAPETYFAPRGLQVGDADATEDERELAANNVRAIYETDPLVRSRVEGKIVDLFREVRQAPFGQEQALAIEMSAANPASTGVPNEFEVEYTVMVENPTTRTPTYDLAVTPRFAEGVSVLSASYTQDRESDGVPERSSTPLQGAGPWELIAADAALSLRPRATDTHVISVVVAGDEAVVTELGSDCSLDDGENGTGLLAEIATSVSGEPPLSRSACRVVPTLVTPQPPGDGTSSSTTSSTTTTTTTSTTLAPIAAPPTTVPTETQVETLEEDYPVYGDAIPVLVATFDINLALVEAGQDGFFDSVEQQIIDQAGAFLADGIRQSDLGDVQNSILVDPPRLAAPLDADQLDELEGAGATVLAFSLEPNEFVDEVATEEARQAAAAAVPQQTRSYVTGEIIVRAGEPIDAVELAAITEFGLLDPEPGASRIAAMLLGGLAVLLAALFLWRIAPARWSQPKHIALLGVLMLIAAAIARLAELPGIDNPLLVYAVPASLLGYSAAILYDPRTALLTAMPMAVFIAITTQDPALTIFAAVATMTPVAFVSAVSTRRELRLAVLLSALVLAPVAGAVSWLFNGGATAGEAALWGFVGGLVGGLVGQSVVAFLENMFQVTTTVTLLDLTDRNHTALRLIEDQAPGTFNHSILVGNLAGKAARAIGADPLFAQAAAFYHDLGKTEHPQYFIENQFGVSNPHDELSPEESAEIIRRHVTDGLRLARQHRIPSEVAAGIQQHHGSGLMRYFYHKAMEEDPSVDPSLFRHHGIKPQRKELAILMISDAVEGAARALAQQEDPTADSLQKLVESIVSEKQEDGQLDESDLTFGDLTNVKRALVEALIGYYHTRIPYPGFPGPRVERV